MTQSRVFLFFGESRGVDELLSQGNVWEKMLLPSHSYGVENFQTWKGWFLLVGDLISCSLLGIEFSDHRNIKHALQNILLTLLRCDI